MGYDSNDLDDGTFKPCPFCGGDASLRLYEPPFTKSRYFYVQCDNCEAMTSPVQIVDHRQICEAIEKWNRRQDDVAPVRRGRWEWDRRIESYRCSSCQRHNADRTAFCPNCGADLREDTT